MQFINFPEANFYSQVKTKLNCAKTCNNKTNKLIREEKGGGEIFGTPFFFKKKKRPFLPISESVLIFYISPCQEKAIFRLSQYLVLQHCVNDQPNSYIFVKFG